MNSSRPASPAIQDLYSIISLKESRAKQASEQDNGSSFSFNCRRQPTEAAIAAMKAFTRMDPFQLRFDLTLGNRQDPTKLRLTRMRLTSGCHESITAKFDSILHQAKSSELDDDEV